MSKVHLSTRIYEETNDLLSVIDYSKLKIGSKGEYIRKAIENQLERDGLDTIEKIIEKGLKLDGT